MKNVYGYIRVSTAKQGEGVSLIAQKEAITSYASKYNLNIIRWFEEKETAAKQGRPLFTTMMQLLQKKKGEGVIIHKIDRGARNLKDWADMGNLIDQGIEVHFAHESLDLQARGGRLSADIQAVIAADYIRNLRQEAIKGIYGRLQQGILPFNAPVGYINTGKGKCKTIDPVKGPLVKKAFQLYATRKYSLETLTQEMYRLGLRNIANGTMHRNSVSGMLNNQYYMGIIKIKGKVFNGVHDPLISPSLFNEVQDVLWGNTHQKVKKHSFKYSRLIACSRCGYSLTPETQKGKIYYRCHLKLCETTGIKERTIENVLLNALAAVELYPMEYEALDMLVKEAESEWATHKEERLTAIRLQFAQLQQRMERLTDCYVDGGLEREVYEGRKVKLLQEIKAVEASERNLLNGNEQIINRTKKIFEQAKNLTDSYQKANPEEKRKLVQKITSNMASDGKNVVISMKSPFYELANRRENNSGAPQRDSSRKLHTRYWHFEQNTSYIGTIPISKEALKELFDELCNCVKLNENGGEP